MDALHSSQEKAVPDALGKSARSERGGRLISRISRGSCTRDMRSRTNSE